MRLDITNRIDLENQEVYTFDFTDNCGKMRLIFDGYVRQSKEVRQRIWRTKGAWSRLNNRDNNIKEPPKIPPSIESELRQQLVDALAKTPIATSY